MPGYNVINAYDADIRIPEFKGLMQYGDSLNADPRFAVEEFNVETTGGVLMPCAACTLLPATLPAPIETLALLHRRWHTATTDKDILIAAAGGKLYSMLTQEETWTELTLPSGVTQFQSNDWSWVTYEINPEGSTASVDVLLLSNAQDGMVMVRGDTLSVEPVPTPKRFGVIERYAERIWGGAIPDDPDMLVYSAPFDPTNWEADVEIPEDGAGDINQPSWDGDSFTALRSFGSQLIAFKKTRVWRILGTDPGEYTFKEQYGGGAPYASTIAVDTERILMLTRRGIVAYDGLAVAAFQQEYTKGLWSRIHEPFLSQACATVWQGRYYCAVPVDGSPVNNAVLVYNPVDRTWLLRNDVSVERFLPTEDTLYFTSATTPGRVWHWEEDSWESGSATKAATCWVTPWNDLRYRQMVKGGFELYLLCEVQDRPVTLSITLQTEKKSKTKQYTIQPLTTEERLKGKSHKQKRLHFGGAGRMFRLIIETAQAGNTEQDSPPWRLVGGLLMIAEIDSD